MAGSFPILFLTSTRIGDAILSSGLLKRLHDEIPQARFTVAAGAPAAPLFRDTPRLDRVIEGEPVALARDGEVLHEHLIREAITEEELMEAIRKQGLSSIDQAAEVVLETGGAITVVPRTTTEARLHRLDRRLDQIAEQLGQVHSLLQPDSPATS